MTEQLWKVFKVDVPEGNSRHPDADLLGVISVPEEDWASMALDLGYGDTGDEAMYRIIEKVFSLPGLTSMKPQVRQFQLFACQSGQTDSEDFLVMNDQGEAIARISPVEVNWMGFWFK